jgi:hypothetical protein
MLRAQVRHVFQPRDILIESARRSITSSAVNRSTCCLLTPKCVARRLPETSTGLCSAPLIRFGRSSCVASSGHHPLPCCGDHRPGTISTVHGFFQIKYAEVVPVARSPGGSRSLQDPGNDEGAHTITISAGLPIRPCTPLAFSASSRSSRGCFGRINVRSFLSSPLIVLGKRLKLTRNVLVGHCLGSAEQSLSCF